MSEIAALGFNDGTGSEWTTVTIANNGAVAYGVAAALADSFAGMAATVSSATDKVYGDLTISYSTAVFRVRLYMDTNGITMGDGEKFAFFNGKNNTSYSKITLQYTIAGGYAVFISVRADASGSFTDSAAVAITDQQHRFEFCVHQASSDVASDASGELWIDGVSVLTVSGVDLYDSWPLTELTAGQINQTDAGTSGTIYIDEIVANDDGSEIGPRKHLGRLQDRLPARHGGGHRGRG